MQATVPNVKLQRPARIPYDSCGTGVRWIWRKASGSFRLQHASRTMPIWAHQMSTSDTRSDDSPSLKGRGFYGFAPRLCRPTAIRLASFNTREVECAAPAYRTSTTSKTRSCFYPRERLTVERPNTIQLARCYQAVSHISSDARLRARRHSSPALKRRGRLPPQRLLATASHTS